MKRVYIFFCLFFLTNICQLLTQNLTYEITDYQRFANSSVQIGDYLFYESEGSIYRVDISNPKLPGQSIKITNIEGIDLVYFGKYLYSFSYGQTIALNLYDVTNPLNVTKVGSYTFTEGGFFRLQEFQNKLFILNDPNSATVPKLIVLDISNPSDIKKIAEKTINANRSDDAMDFQVTPDLKRAYILTKIYYFIYDITDLTNITLLKTDRAFYPSLSISLEVVGNDLFIAGWANKDIIRFDVTDPTKPITKGKITLTNNIYEIFYDGSHLVAIDGTNLNYYTISYPGVVKPKEKSSNNIQNGDILTEYGKVTFADNVYKVIFNNEGNIIIQEGGEYYPDYKSNSGGKLKYGKITKKQDKVTLTTQVLPVEASEAGCKVTPEGKTQHEKNSIVTVIATSGKGWKFKEFTGDLSGSEAQQNIKMTGDKGVTGNFKKIEPILTLAATNSNDGKCASDVYNSKENLIFSGSLSADEEDDWNITQLAFYVTGNSVYFDKLKLKLGGKQYIIDYQENHLNKFSVSYLLKAGEQVNWLLYLIPNEKTFFGCELPEIVTHNTSIIVSDVIATPVNYSPGKKLPQEVLSSGNKFLYCISDGNATYANFIEAVNKSPEKSTLTLCEGSFYPKSIDINKSLNFIGQSRDKTILTSVNSGIILNIGSNVFLKNLKIKGSINPFNGELFDIVGFKLYEPDNNIDIDFIIENVTFENLATGVYSASKQNINVTNCDFQNNDICINIYDANKINISNSIFKDSKTGIICKEYYKVLKLLNSSFENNISSIHISPRSPDYSVNETLIKGNKIINNYNKIKFGKDKLEIIGIGLNNLSFAEIIDNNVSFTGFINSKIVASGIYLYGNIKNCYINKNDISGAFSAITLWGNYSFNNEHHISENKVHQNIRGISIDESNENKIIGNKIYSNIGGIILSKSKDNLILANEFSWNLKNIVGGIIKIKNDEQNKLQNSIEEYSGGLILMNSSANVQNNHFEKDSSAAILMLGNSNATINYNNFIDTYDYAINNQTQNNVNALYNYWNSPKGPRLAPTGEGERVSSKVIYDNFKAENIKYAAGFDRDTLYNRINQNTSFAYYIANWTSTPNQFQFSLNDNIGKIQNIKDKLIEIDSLNFTEIVNYLSEKTDNNQIFLEVTPKKSSNNIMRDTLFVISYQPIMKDIVIIPDTLFVNINEIGILSSLGIDQYQQSSIINPKWTATGGKIDTNGVYTAGNKPGIYQATATYDKLTKNSVIVVKDTVLSVTNNLPKEDLQTLIFPNPSVSTFNINIYTNDDLNTKINIFSTTGYLLDKLFEGYLSSGINSFVWKATSYPNGTYLLIIDTGSRRYAYNLIINK